MSQEPIPLDMEAALRAVQAGQSLARHVGMSDEPARVLYAAAVGHHEACRYAQAIRCLLQVTALDARMPDAWALLGNSLMHEGKFAEALEAWAVALHLKPGFASAHQVARTALALKELPTAAIGLVSMFKHATTDEQRSTCFKVGDALRDLNERRPRP